MTATTLPNGRLTVEVTDGYDIGRLIDTQLAVLIDLALASGADAWDLHLRLVAASEFINDLECDLEPVPAGEAPF
jgi:hypothetical protein